MTFKAILQKTYRESKGVNPLTFVFCLLVQCSMQSLKTHSRAFFILQKLQFFKQEIAEFYLAEIFYFYGDFERSLEYLNNFLKTNPNHADAIYLKATLLAFLGQRQESFNLLGNLLQTSSRLKTWIILAKIIETSQDFEVIEQFYIKNIHNFEKFKTNQDEILRYLARAAVKVGEYEKAKVLLRESLFLFSQRDSKNLSHKKAMDLMRAKEALEDLQNLFKENNIEMFLISGTFLGCVREKNFIAHDNDIDIGIWQKDMSKIERCVLTSKAFIIRDNIPNLIQIRHLNGIPLDIFVHYEEQGRIYHNGHFQRWSNSLFALVEYEFLGRKYLAPQNYDLYLTENYGKDYLLPKNSSQYNYVLSTPNIEILDKQKYIIFLYVLLFDCFSAHNKPKILEELKRAGEGDFVEEYLTLKRSE